MTNWSRDYPLRSGHTSNIRNFDAVGCAANDCGDGKIYHWCYFAKAKVPKGQRDWSIRPRVL